MQGDRREIPVRIVGERLVHVAINRDHAATREKIGVAVGAGTQRVLRGDQTASSLDVLDHERAAKILCQLVGDPARNQVRCQPRTLRNQEPDRL